MDACPFLVPVVADRLWLYPTSAYCRRPGCPLRVPAAITLTRVCTTPLHAECSAYSTSMIPPGASGGGPSATSGSGGPDQHPG